MCLRDVLTYLECIVSQCTNFTSTHVQCTPCKRTFAWREPNLKSKLDKTILDTLVLLTYTTHLHVFLLSDSAAKVFCIIQKNSRVQMWPNLHTRIFLYTVIDSTKSGFLSMQPANIHHINKHLRGTSSATWHRRGDVLNIYMYMVHCMYGGARIRRNCIRKLEIKHTTI